MPEEAFFSRDGAEAVDLMLSHKEVRQGCFQSLGTRGFAGATI